MEKRTPNDADDGGPLGQHHQCPMRETWLLLAAESQKTKCNRGLEHGEPAQRTMSKVIIDGFP